MKQLTLLLAFLLLFTNSLFALSDKELATSINLAGKQRMLIQKITKEALLIHANLDKKDNLNNLNQSSKLFDQIIRGLIHGDKSLNLVPLNKKPIQKQLKVVDGLWEPFYKDIKSILSGKAKDSSYKFLEKNNMNLLKEMNKVVALYTSENSNSSKLKLANDINLAGKQRMLTQRMAKDLLAISNNLDKQKHIEDFKKIRNLFTQTLKGLLNGDKKLNLIGTKLAKIVEQLNVVDKSWKDIQPLLDNASKGKDEEKAISGLDNILVEMNKAVSLYTQSLNREKQRLKLASILGNFMNKNKILKKRVNFSGRQRMLVQRMTKLSLLISFNINKKSNTQKLIKYSKLYDKTLNAFNNGDKDLGCIPTNNKEIKKQIEIVEKEWKPFYKNIQTIIEDKDKDKKALSYLVSKNELLLKKSNDLVKVYEKTNKSENFLEKARVHVINIAGRQRMLSQKMAKEKLLVVQGKKEYSDKLKGTIKLFDDSLNTLINGDSKKGIIKPSNKHIKEQLIKVAHIWSKLKPLYEKEKSTTKELAVIIKQNPILLFEMDNMVKLAENQREY
ncbi:MAG: type IV pili methyl-accepting chemotaxis transducer N-terminal domain-containing protein [Sulfurovaceae bacterium]|nr:type IV pili methyl-accepting chemotaxis transducer N-terminal domain-containing protein [Sulfurovaceae bacterium]